MHDLKPASPIETAIAANLEALAALLKQASDDATEAVIAIQAHQRNLAIGTVLDLDRLLADATALHGAAVALHRRMPI